MARNQVRPNVGQQLKVVQPSLHESLLQQQQELQAQLKLSINKPIKQTSKRNVKATAKPKHKKGANRLEAPYVKPTPTKPRKASSAEHKKQKQEMLDWLNNVRIG